MGHEVHVITSNESIIDKDEMCDIGIALHLLNCKALHTSKFKIDFYWNVWKKLIELKPDVCLIRTAPLAPIVLLYTEIYKKKFIYSVTHDKDCLIRRVKWSREFIKVLVRRLCQFAIKSADIVVAQSVYQKELLKKNFGVDSFVIRNGHYIPELTSPKADPPIVLWLANLRKEKRIDLFVELAQRLEGMKCLFVVAGKPMDDGCLEVLEEGIKKQENLYYYGALSVKQALELVNKSSLLVNTSDNEGFPNAFIEAWMRKTPTVGLNVDPDNLIKDYKMGFHSFNFENLVRDVKYLLENKSLLDELGRNAYKYAIEQHDLSKISKMYADLF